MWLATGAICRRSHTRILWKRRINSALVRLCVPHYTETNKQALSVSSSTKRLPVALWVDVTTTVPTAVAARLVAVPELLLVAVLELSLILFKYRNYNCNYWKIDLLITSWWPADRWTLICLQILSDTNQGSQPALRVYSLIDWGGWLVCCNVACSESKVHS